MLNQTLNNNLQVFFVTPYFCDDPNHIKGGYYLIQLAHLMKNYIFLVAGPYKANMELPNNIILLGNVVDQKKLASYYSMSDLTLILSKRETFSMVVAESLCSGTPVVGFLAGAPEMISISKYSLFSEFGDLESLKNNILLMLQKNYDRLAMSRESIEKYSKKNMFNQYYEIYDSMISKK